MQSPRFALRNLYPLVFGIFPVLSLYVSNCLQIEFFRVIRSILISLLVSGITLLLFRLVFRKPAFANVMASFILIVLMNFGTLYLFLNDNQIGSLNLSRVRYMVAGISILLFALFLAQLRNKKVQIALDNFFVWFSIALLLVLIVNIAKAVFSSVEITSIPSSSDQIADRLSESREQPDIYYIILDGYTSSDALLEDFRFDNTEFESELTELGFDIPYQAYSNYDETIGSLSSSLNMDWVQNLVPDDVKDHDRRKLTKLLVNNRVRAMLEDQGYNTVAFENEFRWSLWKNADYYEAPLHLGLFSTSLNSFELMYLESTLYRLAMNLHAELDILVEDEMGPVNLDKNQEQTYILRHLADLPEEISPKFVYAHTTITHVPFVFNLDGSLLPGELQGYALGTDFSDPNIREGYIFSIQYVNEKMLAIVKEIITEDPNAIIILQGDHGYPGRNRHQIFMAVYDPKGSIANVDCMTPINLFRLLFNNWFDTNLEMLPDDIYIEADQDYYIYEFIGGCGDFSAK